MVSFKHKKYVAALLLSTIALVTGGWLWNTYMLSPWTRDGRLLADISQITPLVSGHLIDVKIKDNQKVKKGTVIFQIDPTDYQHRLAEAKARQVKVEAEYQHAQNEAERRRKLPVNSISIEQLEVAELNEASLQAQLTQAQIDVKQAALDLERTQITAPADGYITNLSQRPGNYVQAGKPLVALVEDQSFYAQGYFEETKLKNIKVGQKTIIKPLIGDFEMMGEVESIGLAISDQSASTNTRLLADIKPSIPWIRLAQRIPVRIKINNIPDTSHLVAGSTCTIIIKPKG